MQLFDVLFELHFWVHVLANLVCGQLLGADLQVPELPVRDELPGVLLLLGREQLLRAVRSDLLQLHGFDRKRLHLLQHEPVHAKLALRLPVRRGLHVHPHASVREPVPHPAVQQLDRLLLELPPVLPQLLRQFELNVLLVQRGVLPLRHLLRDELLLVPAVEQRGEPHLRRLLYGLQLLHRA